MHSKNKKLEKLCITASNNQVSPGTTIEDGTTTGKSIVNLSDHTLQLDEIKVLSRGLNLCPTTKMDPTGLAADTEEFIRRMRVQDFFQDVSREPNETTSESDHRNIVIKLAKEDPLSYRVEQTTARKCP
eukprot:g30682.t1